MTRLTRCAGFAVCLVFTSCAFTPTPVLITSKPSWEETLPANGQRVALRVSDGRPDLVAKARLCGTKRNGYMIPTSFAFIAHQDTLDVILARHIRQTLEVAGYEVVSVEPPLPEEDGGSVLEAPPVSEEELEAATDIIEESEPEERDSETGDVTVRDLGTTTAPGADALASRDATLLLDVTIREFNTDMFQAVAFVSVQGWCGLDCAAWLPGAPQTAIVAKEVRGFGTSGPRMVITDECYTTALNMAYWFALDSIEDLVRDPDLSRRASSPPTTSAP